ncbi:MAG: JAB domain-containing protein [Sphingomonas sp.]
MAASEPSRPKRLPDLAAAGALFAPLADERFEVVAFAYLDADQGLLGMRQARSQSVDTLDLPIRDVVADVLRLDAQAVVMAHNHPSGDATPSAADRDATRMLAHALRPLGVRLIDHLVVTRTRVISFRELGLL